MAGLVPAIHALSHVKQDVDGRDKPGRDAERMLRPNWRERARVRKISAPCRIPLTPFVLRVSFNRRETPMIVQNYLSFDGRCEEAIEFYKRALGAEVQMLMRFKDAPQEQQCAISPGSENKVMHACLRIGETQVMASDGRC